MGRGSTRGFSTLRLHVTGVQIGAGADEGQKRTDGRLYQAPFLRVVPRLRQLGASQSVRRAVAARGSGPAEARDGAGTRGRAFRARAAASCSGRPRRATTPPSNLTRLARCGLPCGTMTEARVRPRGFIDRCQAVGCPPPHLPIPDIFRETYQLVARMPRGPFAPPEQAKLHEIAARTVTHLMHHVCHFGTSDRTDASPATATGAKVGANTPSALQRQLTDDVSRARHNQGRDECRGSQTTAPVGPAARRWITLVLPVIRSVDDVP